MKVNESANATGRKWASLKKAVWVGEVCMLLVQNACNTRLNDEQRRQLSEARKQIEIRQVPEAELLSEAFLLGQQIAQNLPDSFAKPVVKRLSDEYQVSIKWYDADVQPRPGVIKDLMNAFAFTLANDQKPESHVQRHGTDSVLFVKPAIRGSKAKPELGGAWVVAIPVRKIVLGLPGP